MPMVCTADDLLGWKDFPKGLRVLLLDEDTDSATQITSKLEDMDYVVSSFRSENEALSAISDDSKCFHVAIVEVREDNKDGRFRFLESTKDLPTIMTSDVNCISTMMKCIALGAVEFLEKPISEDKLRNIWQHVAHKAFNGGPTEALKSSSDLNKVIIKEEKVMGEIDKYPAPSTPQLKQGTRSVDDHMDQEQTTEKEFEGQSKFVEPTCNSEANGNGNAPTTTITITDTATTTEEDIIGQPTSTECCPDPITDATQASDQRPKKSSRRKIKVDWTSELHKKFVEAVEQLGVDQAIPSRILELMNVEGLTRHNVASHLQKYRLQRRHILPKDGGRKWPQTRHSTAVAGTRNSYPQKPIMAYPPPPPLYPAWPLPHTTYPQMWAPPYYHPWHSSDNWIWNSPPPYSGVQAQTWGCPTHASFHQNTSEFQSRDSMHNRHGMPKNSFDNYPGEEVIDKIVKEAINKPWLPLPLGLKPPSTESVISELSKQGISTIPPAAASID